MGIMGIEPTEHAGFAIAQALSTADAVVCEWYAASGPEVWTPMHVYAHMAGMHDREDVVRAAVEASRQTADSVAMDVDGVPSRVTMPGPATGWSLHWNDPYLPDDHDPDILCMAVDWPIALLVSNGRIVVPDDMQGLNALRQVAVRAIVDEELEPDASFEDMADAAAVAILRHSGTRLPNHDRDRILAMQRQIPSDVSIDDIAAAWPAHALVHRRLHADLNRRFVDPAAVMALAHVLMAIDLPASGSAAADPGARNAFALHAVHDAIRTMLMQDIYEMGEAHLYSLTLGGRTTRELSDLIRAEDDSILGMIDALALRAFARRVMQTLGTPPFLSDVPYLMEKTRSILLLELDRVDESIPMADALAEWMIGLAVATILDSQNSDQPHDPVWRTISREMSDDDQSRANPDALSSEHMETIREGRSITKGRVILTGVLIHCVDPVQDDETEESIRSVLPQAGPMLPGDVHLSRIVRLPRLPYTLREAMDLADDLRETCDVHAAHLVGTIDGRALLIDSHDGNSETVAHAGGAPTIWN